YEKVSFLCSKTVTKQYSTSFSAGIGLLSKEFRDPVYAIYGFVRFADEIVDTFHDYNKADLLERFKSDTYRALDERISLNPILHCFQKTVNQYNIDRGLIDTFLKSMTMDLDKKAYNEDGYKEYILGSAEVVGLMCLKIFCRGDEQVYQALKADAMKLGSAFQKINFLRDLRADYQVMGRTYFPGLDFSHFNENEKIKIESDIQQDFDAGYRGIKMLPKDSRLGVYISYSYYLSLFKKVKHTPADVIMHQRIRISDAHKYLILIKCYLRNQLNLV
ncbi:MAG: phytoene/squalene synthase family protein, partial [Cytophagaceae bacterium]|nr:phytoene/squalene synthase family protein [Cytophagaceae bacterium]